MTASSAPSTGLGFVMAGGRSERMMRDKALLPWRDVTLLEHAVERVRRGCGEARILCGPTRRYEEHGAPIVVDEDAEAGPLGGVYSGLRTLARGAAVFLAVDLPEVPASFLRYLLTAVDGWDAAVPRHGAGVEPLCAAYDVSCLEAIRRRLESRDLRMTSFWPEVRVRLVSVDEIREFGDPTRLFRNLNAPGDLEGG